MNSADYVKTGVKMNFACAINATCSSAEGYSRLVDNEFSPQMGLSSLILTFFDFFSTTQDAVLRETTIGQTWGWVALVD